ncbi:MAG TPA: hypothetical protein VLB83_02570 [Candidatus Paceibacterota bacterium]|nr:hypothetical protein [Candidatus Paceibacterota bacterium]
MINLLPQHEKRAQHIEYRLRIAIVASVLAFYLMVIAGFVFAPAYYSLYLKVRNLNTSLEARQRAVSAEVSDAQTSLADVKAQVDILKAGGTDMPPTKVIDLIASKRHPGIAFASFSYEDIPGARWAQVRGFSETRDALTFFRKNLREDERFKDAELPANVFVKETDLDFSMRINIK